MNRYTVYLNRPKPNHQVVVYADRYRIEDPLNVVPRLILERDHGDPVAFTDWDAIVPDEPVEEPSGFRDAVGNSFEDSAPGPSQAWWEKGHFHADPQMSVGTADEEPDYDDTDDQVRYEEWNVQLFTDNPLESWPVVGGSYDGAEWVSDRGEVDTFIDTFPYHEDHVSLIDGTEFRFYRYATMFPTRAHEILAERFPGEVGEKLQYPSRCIGGDMSGAYNSCLPDGYRGAFITFEGKRERVFVPEDFQDEDILKEILRLGLGV